MILITIILALINVYVINQIGFWGLMPVLLSILVYALREQARFAELLLVAAVYGFVISTFSPASDGFFIYSASILATSTAIISLRFIHSSRFKTRLQSLDALFVASIFTVVYLVVVSLPVIGYLNLLRFFATIGLSIVINFAVMIGVDLSYRRLAGK